MRVLSNISPTTAYWTVALSIWVVLTWAAFNFQAATFTYDTDFWEHSAVLRAWMQDLWHPASPHVSSNEGSVRYIPFYFVITVISAALRLTPIEATGLAALVNVTLLVIGVKLFSDRYFRNPWGATVSLTVFLSGWGVAWTWSNVYQMRDLLYVSAYPSFFVFAFGFFCYWWLLGLLRAPSPSAWRLAGLALFVAIAFSSHPLTGVAVIVMLGLLVIFERDVQASRRLSLLGILLVGSLLVELWPYFSTWKLLFGKHGAGSLAGSVAGSLAGTPGAAAAAVSRAKELYWGHPFYQLSEVLLTFGPALLGVPAALFLAKRRKLWLPLAGCVIFTIPYVLNILVKVPLGHRFLLFVIFFTHISLTWVFLDFLTGPNSSTMRRKLVLVTLTIMLSWNVGLVIAEINGYSLKPAPEIINTSEREGVILANMRALAKRVPEDSIIIAPTQLAWPVPTFVGKIVAGHHPNPLISDSKQRAADVSTFFSEHANFEERERIMKHYEVTHILLDPDKLSSVVYDTLVASFGKAERVQHLNLIEVAR